MTASGGGRLRFEQPTAFFLALIGAPAVIGGVGWALWTLGALASPPDNPIAVAGAIIGLSAPFGAPFYVIFGGAFFWRIASRGADSVWRYVGAGFIANAAAAPVTLLLLVAVTAFNGGSMGGVSIALAIHGFGLVFAPFYGAVFGWLYLRFIRHPGLPRGAPPADQTVEVFR